VVRAANLPGVTAGELVHVGVERLLGEVIHLAGDRVTVELYEESGGLRVGDRVVPTGGPLVAWLGPGLLGATFDGLQRPLDRLAGGGNWKIGRGASAAAVEHWGMAATVAGVLDPDRSWPFEPEREIGDHVRGGDVLGTVAEGSIRHRILVPPGTRPGRLIDLRPGARSVADSIAALQTADGSTIRLGLAHPWPVRVPRPVAHRLPVDRPLVTGTRAIDLVFPIGRGGTAVIPGGFGTGKTVVEQSLARWSDADVVVYVGCGERGNEIAELLATFPQLVDPRTGGPLAGRTVLIANTSNMPVAAREASVQLGMTIAEYYRDQGLHVALLADSTSRWAEALREIGGRLEELPGEEGFPAYLGSRLAAFYERAGQVRASGSPERIGSITVVGAVSPPGGDFSEPVTQASLRLAGTFWALDAGLAHARHFPAIGWTQSYSLYADALGEWFAGATGADWARRRGEAIELLARERALLDIVALVGADALPDGDRVLLEVARLLREAFLQQHAFDPVDAARPVRVQFALLEAVLAARDGLLNALERGASLDAALAVPELSELVRARGWSADGDDEGLVERLRALRERVAHLQPVAREDHDVPRAVA
jgi:V/A-type H+-transporting ATPase subunit A